MASPPDSGLARSLSTSCGSGPVRLTSDCTGMLTVPPVTWTLEAQPVAWTPVSSSSPVPPL